MLFCLGASVPKEDEYHFLSEEEDDDDDDLVGLVHQDRRLILDLDQEAHDNCINADLLQAAVQAVVNNNQQQQQQQTKSATLLHKHRNQSSAQVKHQHRTFRRKSSCSPDAHQHHSSVAKFVDTNSSSSSSSSSLSSSLAIIGGNSVATTTGIVGGSSTNNSHNNVALPTTGSTLLSKLGPSHLGKKLGQLRSKGTENLQREALRKSNEQAVAAATGKCIDHSQRYIRLPPSPHSKKFPTSVEQPNFSVNNNNKHNSPGAVVVHSANSCDSIARTKAKLSILSTHQQQSIQSVSANPSPIVSRSSSGRSNKSCCSSPTPPSGNKHHSSGILLHKAQNHHHHHHLTTQPPPPSLVPRSANNPPPRPKADKPNKSNMSSSTTTSRHNVVAVGDVASSSTMMILCPTNSTNNGSTATTATTSTSSKKNIDCLSQSQNGESSTIQRLTTSSCHHPLVSSSTCSSSSQQQQQQQPPQPTSTTALISSSRQTSMLGVMNPQQCATGNPHIMQQQQQQQHPAQHIDAVSCSSSTASTSANNGNNTNMLPHHSHHHHHHQQFINKPPRGWLHPDQKLTDSGQGVTYTVRYIGCLGVNTSMKSLDFQTRSLIAKESINRVCEAAGLKTVDKKRRIDKRIAGMLADSPNMEHAGMDANLSITISYLTLTVADTGQVLAKHEMPNISFASGGDTDTLDFAAYVAKDSRFERACFVLECEGGRAQEVITTIGQAFELRFNEFLKRNPLSSNHESSNHSNINNVPSIPAPRIEDREYYNDLPGKIPPDIISLNHSDKDHPLNGTTSSNAKVIPVAAPRNKNNKSPLTIAADNASNQINLIDLNDDAGNGCPKTSTSSGAASLLAKLLPNDPQYVNCMSEMADKDPFDMQPFNNALASHVSSSSTMNDDQSKSVPNPNQTKSASSSKSNSNITTVTDNSSLKYVLNSDLTEEEWFHGPISRKDSETLVVRDGDFLVRESQASPGQYVLTGMQGGSRKHLLLVDPEGVVRTKDKTFDSVSHLINYHRNNGLPIISSESALILKNPIIVPAKNS